MNLEEQDRLFEILLYLYFTNFSSELSSKAEFWTTIKAICLTFGISEMSISRAIRILSANENVPQDEETYYLLNKLGLTVRPIRKISGIYWQKQKEFERKFESSTPTIHRRITDVVLKRNIRNFIQAVYQMAGIFNYIDIRLTEKLL